MVYFISRSILWLLFKICFKYRVRHGERVPRTGPFIIAANHLSFLDPGAVGFITSRKVHFMARADLFGNSFFRWWAASVGVIPISRGRFDMGAIKGTLACLKRGGIIALFPEGTRSRDGIIREAKAGVGFVAVRALVPVVPVYVRGSDNALPAHASFIRLKPVEARVGEPVYPHQYRGSDGEYDYQAMSDEVMARIKRLSVEA